MMNTSELKKTIQNKRLLTKKDLVKIAVNDPDINPDELTIETALEIIDGKKKKSKTKKK